MMWPRMLLAFLFAGMAAVTGSAEEMRVMRYQPGSPEAARAWQESLRVQLAALLHIDDLIRSRASIPLEAEVSGERKEGGITIQDVRLHSTPERMINVRLARPVQGESGVRWPAVVCIHGHGGTRNTPFDPDVKMYKQFGLVLARQGFVVVSADVGQHEVYEKGRTLMGERLWDLSRCVDYLEALPEVDARRIGCAGLSLGGEMAMWLGAMDARMAATASCGFLTFMDQMEQNHCMCWKFDGLRALADFPDIYALIAPRPLQCQNGLKEPETQFNVRLAQKAMEQIRKTYADMGVPENAALLVHEGGHEIALEPLVQFLRGALGSNHQPISPGSGIGGRE